MVQLDFRVILVATGRSADGCSHTFDPLSLMSLPCRGALAVRLHLYRSLHTGMLQRRCFGSKKPIDTHPTGPSRTRLVKDLTPRSKKGGRLVVAAPEFSRDPLPHVGRPEKRRASPPPPIFQPSAERLARKHSRHLSRAERKGEVRGKAPEIPVTKRDPLRSPNRVSGLSKEVRTSVATAKTVNPLDEEFDLSASNSRSLGSTPGSFSSPPLLDGLRDSVHQILGQSASPTPIQALSLKHLFSDTPEWRQYLLASETGSGKSIAYLLPMLHHLKKSELAPLASPSVEIPPQPRRAVNPRALVLAPTHELSRQLSSSSKALLHNIKLRVVCASRANVKSTPRMTFTASKMAAQFVDDAAGTLGMPPLGASRPVDVLVGTPNKLLEMARGRKWDRVKDETDKELATELSGSRPETSSRSLEPEMGLQNIEWVVVDEADILFGNSQTLIHTTDETDDPHSRPRLPRKHSNALSRYCCRPWPVRPIYPRSSPPLARNLNPIYLNPNCSYNLSIQLNPNHRHHPPIARRVPRRLSSRLD